MIEMREGAHIQVTTKFNYIGTKLTSKLSDNLDVKTRITIPNSQMGQMKDWFRYKDISCPMHLVTVKLKLIVRS
jgi:hypothetical protein